MCLFADPDGDDIFDSQGHQADGGNCGEALDQPEGTTDVTDVVRARWLAAGASYALALSPKQSQNVKGSSHTVTATVTDAFGAPVADQKVDFDIVAGSRNDRGTIELNDAKTDAQGQVSFTYTDTGASGSDTIAAYVDNDANDQADQNADGTAVKDEAQASFDATPQPGSARNIRVSPAEATNPAGAEQVFTATVTDRYGNAVPDVDVAFSESGPGSFAGGASSSSGRTDSQGKVEVRATSAANETGDQQITASLSAADTDCELAAGAPAGAGAGNCSERAVAHWTTSRVTLPGAAKLDCAPEDSQEPAGTAVAYSCKVYDDVNNNGVKDASEAPVAGVAIDGENLQGANDPDNDKTGGASSTADFNDAGVTDADGGARVVVPGAAMGNAQVCFWADADGDESFDTSASGLQVDGKGCAGELPAQSENVTDYTDVVNAVWYRAQSPAAKLNCSPEESRNVAGTPQTYTCVLWEDVDHDGNKDADETPIEGVALDGESLKGAKDPDNDEVGGPSSSPDFNDAGTTDAAGKAQVVVPSTRSEPGVSIVCWWGDFDADNVFDVAFGQQDGGNCDSEPQNQLETETDYTDEVAASWPERSPGPSKLDCAPELVNATGTQAVYDCSLYEDTNTNGIKDDGEKGIAGVAIDGENLQGANDPDNDKTGGPASTVDYNDGGTTDELGRAKVTVSGAQPGAAEVCFYADADLDNVFDAHGAPSDGGDCAEAPGEAESVTDTTDVVSARWGTAGVAYRLTLSPRQATKVKGATHTVTATVTDAFGAPVANQKVDFDITAGSRNDRGGLEHDDAPTDARGEASFTYTDTGATGSDTIAAYLDNDGNDQADPNADGGAVRDEAQASFDAAPQPVTLPGAAKLDCTPEEASAAAGVVRYSCSLYDDANHNGIKDAPEAPVANAALDGENLAGANDPDNDPAGGPQSSPDYNDAGVTDAQGEAQVQVTGARWGQAALCFYADADLDNVFDAHGAPSDGGDCAEAPGEAESVTDTTDVVSARWGTAGVAYRLTLSPRQATKVKGATHTVTATVTDAFGAPVANQKVDFDITAGSRNDRGGLELDDAPTDARGEASFTYTDTGATGSDTIAAYLDNDGNDQADPNADGGAVRDEAQASFDAAPQPGSARSIRLSPAEATNPAGGEQVFTATVIDRYGNRVPNVKVDFTETGAGNFANGGSSAAGVTDAQGEVKVRATSAANETGDQQIAASLSAADTDCELVAGTPAGAPDGTCVSRAVIHWTGVSQASARNIKLSPAEATNPAGGEQVFTATVTDHNGKPVPGVKVDFAETGAGNFANGGSSAAGVTDAQGELKIKATSAATEAGDQQITASLSAADTDCELLAGTPAGAPEGNCHSRAVAHWTAPPAPGSLDATPERDTKLQGTSHTVEVKAFDAAGAPSAGRQVSFQVVEGPNAAGDLDKDAATPNGFFGRCVTQASGACSQSYSDLAKQFGKDRIVAFQDVNGNAKFDAGTDDAVVATDSVEVAWVSSAEMPNKVAIDMKGCDGDLANPATSWDPQGVPQSVTTDFAKARLVCAVPFGGGKVAFTPITFQLTGKGYFTNSRGENLGPKITVQEPGSQGAAGAGYYSVWLVSPEAGTSTITAGITGFTSTPGTQEWTSARTLKLTPAEATNLAGGEQIVTATVLDAAGKPVQDVTVDFKATGIGHFADGGATASSKTDANGEVQIRATSGRTETGDMKITAAISPTETDCELPAGTPQGAPAGNCSAEAIMHWAVPTGPCKGYLEGSTQPNPASSNGGMVIVGTSANADTLSGTAGDDIICGLGGDDRITGAAGNDLLAGAAGNDIVTGDDGNDRIDGGAGVDTINGVRGNDKLRGRGGSDVMKGGAGKDAIRGDGGNDRIDGGAKSDRINGGAGNDKLRGRGGSDVMKGGAGKDYLRGDGGNDRINGGTGFDICVPGRGRNSVSGCER